MSAPYARLSKTRTTTSIFVFILVASALGLGVCGLLEAMGTTIPAAAITILAAIALISAGVLVGTLISILFKVEADAHRIHETLMDSHQLFEKQLDLLTVMRDNSLISDGAKSITHRGIERDALRKAIREDILKEDWESAYSLIDEMETRFGYRVEAYHYRKEVDEFRAKVIEDKLQTSLRNVRRWINEKDWNIAHAETQRLSKLAPNDPRVHEVTAELSKRKGDFKDELLTSWRQAVDKKDLDTAIELLREIDPYLSREEAEQLESSAREIFKAKLLDLGVQFRSAVTEKRWQQAIQVGDQIRSEFPNSQMAREVGEHMDALRSKAASQTHAAPN